MSVIWNFLFLTSVFFLINSPLYASPLSEEEKNEKNPESESEGEDRGTVSPEEMEKLKKDILETEKENVEKLGFGNTDAPEAVDKYLKHKEKEYGTDLPEEINREINQANVLAEGIHLQMAFAKAKAERVKNGKNVEIVEKSPAEMEKMKEELLNLTNDIRQKEGLSKVTQEKFDKEWDKKKEESPEEFPGEVEDAIKILKELDAAVTSSPEPEEEESTEAPEPSEEEAPNDKFVVKNAEGKICILAKFHSIITVSFSGKEGEQKVEVNVPANANSEGKCASPDHHPSMRLSWQKFVFAFIFNKTSEDTWGVSSVELVYDKSEPLFDGAVDRGKVTAKSKKVNLFETPIGKSYFCPGQEMILLFHADQQVATVQLKEIHLQPYEVENGKFSATHRCSQVIIDGLDAEPFVQDETIPLAVGCTLALITLLILVGFSVHRAYNAAKVDYNAVE